MPAATIDRERLLASFLDLLAFDAPSRREGVIAEYLASLLRELGARVEFDDAGTALDAETGNLIARVPGTVDAPALLFCAHLDTVAPTADLVIRREGGTITSNGTTILGADDRAGVAAIIEMLRVLLESGIPRPPLEIAFTIAEEVGVMGSMAMDYTRLTAAIGFVPDTSGDVGAIVTRAPAQKHLQVTIHGKAAHAGMAPERGVSAITIAARAIARMRQGRIDDETTANIGTIHGGKATNIVADYVEMEGEARSRDPEKLEVQVEHMCRCYEEEARAAGGHAEVTVSDVYPAFNLANDHPAVLLACRGLVDLDLPASIIATGGGSDANFLNQHGIGAVILSAGYRNPHCTDEYQDEEQLALLAQWLVNIVCHAGTWAG